jgi:hypothetical protein
VSLVFGVVFCGMAAVWALLAGDAMEFRDLRVAVPAVLILAGLAGVASSLANTRRTRRHPGGSPSSGSPTSSST